VNPYRGGGDANTNKLNESSKKTKELKGLEEKWPLYSLICLRHFAFIAKNLDRLFFFPIL